MRKYKTRLYAERDHEAQGEHYVRHVDHMTGEGLHDKSAIAAELAHRDMCIERATAIIDIALGAVDAGQSVVWSGDEYKAGFAAGWKQCSQHLEKILKGEET